jgi:hypothetical protein
MFHGVKWPWELILWIQGLKKRLGRSCLNDVLCRPMALRTHNLPSESLKIQLCKIRWWCFNVSKGHAKSFSAYWT